MLAALTAVSGAVSVAFLASDAAGGHTTLALLDLLCLAVSVLILITLPKEN